MSSTLLSCNLPNEPKSYKYRRNDKNALVSFEPTSEKRQTTKLSVGDRWQPTYSKITNLAATIPCTHLPLRFLFRFIPCIFQKFFQYFHVHCQVLLLFFCLKMEDRIFEAYMKIDTWTAHRNTFLCLFLPILGTF